MYNALWSSSIFLGLLILLLLGAVLGRRFGEWIVARNPDHKVEIVGIAEGAVFALLGLLIAFTFTGAYERFEGRKLRIIDEVNAIDTAYTRLDLLPAAAQAPIKDSLKKYVDSRIDYYKVFADLNHTMPQLNNFNQIKNQLWQQVVAAAQATGNPAVIMMLVPAYNNLYEVATTRLLIMQIHPPLVIFIILIIMAVLSAFLGGYAMAGSTSSYSIHLLGYVFICTAIIDTIIELELPRVGLISVAPFDQQLIDERKTLFGT